MENDWNSVRYRSRYFTFESFDFDAKPPTKPQPVTPTYTQYMSCQQGDNYSDFAFAT